VSERRLLTGWGRTAPSLSTVTRLPAEGVPDAIRAAGRRGVLVRGLGRSYGDAAQNAGGDIIVLEDGPPIRLDTWAATVRVGGGTSIDQLIRYLLPHGFFVSVTPGTRFVTVGGAIAADIHGKNHHRHGSLGHHVVEMDLVDAQGRRSTLTPEATPELFWATVGGMGLTGVVVSAVLRVLPVETAYMRVDTDRVANLPDLLAMMSATDDRYTYSVAWIDLLAQGKALGRSVLTRGEHAALTELPEDRQREPLRPAGLPRLSAPGWAPDRLMNHWSVKAFNELWFRKTPRERRDEIQHLSSFFHPLDGVSGWNTLYGRRGLTQYQFVVPLEADAALIEAVRRIAAAGHASFLAVLKRFGPGSPGMLSFPMPGWTLALDLPAAPALAGLLNDLDELVVSAGGRVYLAKDARTSAARIREMYPRLEEFRALRRRTDPERVFRSDLARRLDL
jgi:decaprenylphospho-beta-D-ribofuranose 2-oxidase